MAHQGVLHVISTIPLIVILRKAQEIRTVYIQLVINVIHFSHRHNVIRYGIRGEGGKGNNKSKRERVAYILWAAHHLQHGIHDIDCILEMRNVCNG